MIPPAVILVPFVVLQEVVKVGQYRWALVESVPGSTEQSSPVLYGSFSL